MCLPFVLAARLFVLPSVRVGSERGAKKRRPFLFIQELRGTWNLVDEASKMEIMSWYQSLVSPKDLVAMHRAPVERKGTGSQRKNLDPVDVGWSTGSLCDRRVTNGFWPQLCHLRRGCVKTKWSSTCKEGTQLLSHFCHTVPKCPGCSDTVYAWDSFPAVTSGMAVCQIPYSLFVLLAWRRRTGCFLSSPDRPMHSFR